MTHAPSRREVVAAGAGFVTTGLLSWPGSAQGRAGLASAAAITNEVGAFLDTLDAGQRKAASFVWDGAEWRGWNYFGVGGFIKPGLRLEQMRPNQKEAAWRALAAVLSPAGLEKAKTVMLLQDILAAQGNGSGQRSSERFSVSVFGTPAARGAWGLRLEGHHLTYSVSIRDGAIISVTPSAFSAVPNRVTSGRHAGLVTLKGEERLARRLHADLEGRSKSKSQQSDRQLFNILSYAGSERANVNKVGLAAADMTAPQRDLLWELVETFAVEHVPSSFADAQRRRLRSGDGGAVHFAWYGPNTAETSFGYRVIADSFVIEVGCVDDKAQHVHTIYHDLATTLGRV